MRRESVTEMMLYNYIYIYIYIYVCICIYIYKYLFILIYALMHYIESTRKQSADER